MANLTHNSTKWSDSQNQTLKTKTYSFSTEKKYVDKNIEIAITVPGMNLNPSETFYINDGLNTWTWEIDSNGNVLIY